LIPNPGKLATHSSHLIAIVGPTGAGKSALAIRLAQDLRPVFPGEIVNCDSLQLYRGFDIGTAKTPVWQQAGIAHHMIDVLDPGEITSAGEYARTAREIIAAISARGHLPIIVGGTGFYLKALLDGLPHLPERDESIRARLAQREARRPGSLHRLLRRLDPQAAARMHARDVQKLTRALEIRMLTRAPAPATDHAKALAGYTISKLGLNPDRRALYELLDARVVEMFRSGLLDEVRNLLDSGCTGREKPFESLGYKQALAHLRGEMTLSDAIAATQIETRQYAKRQWTWFRRDKQIHWLDGFGNSVETQNSAIEIVRRVLN